MRNKPKSILKKAKKLIKKGWCKGAFARTASGESVPSDSPDAVKFCAIGAVNRARLALKYGSIDKRAALNLLPCNLTQINDFSTTTEEDILNIFDEAIKKA